MDKYMLLSEYESFQNVLNDKILCNEEYCPWWKEHMCSPSFPTCEGGYCEDAWDNYCDKYDLEFER